MFLKGLRISMKFPPRVTTYAIYILEENRWGFNVMWYLKCELNHLIVVSNAIITNYVIGRYMLEKCSYSIKLEGMSLNIQRVS